MDQVERRAQYVQRRSRLNRSPIREATSDELSRHLGAVGSDTRFDAGDRQSLPAIKLRSLAFAQGWEPLFEIAAIALQQVQRRRRGDTAVPQIARTHQLIDGIGD